MITEEIRSYEVSVWTLQDEFITVLKWSDIGQKGRIENPKMTLNIDGTEKFEFSIPMYYYDNGQKIENPNWYNTRNGNLMISMRKIKVIFNKGTEDKAVYEFLITNIDETHEKDNLVCNIQCEGLAFHELGKIGYKFNLSQELFELDRKNYDLKGYWLDMYRQRVESEPLATVDYWCDKIRLVKQPTDEFGDVDYSKLRSNVWYYRVEMDWSSFEFDGEEVRANDKVYEESYPRAWNTSTLKPTEYEHYKEKCRIVAAENSNVYNITQNIAEKFEIFCRYEYGHDENNNITSRTVIFYNNFVQEGAKSFSLTYPYSSSKITRKMDSQNLTTKLFVLSADDESTARGYNTIMNSEANGTKEDYILNFNYLYANKIISDEQYAEIIPYSIKMRTYNDKIIIKQQMLETYQTQIPEYEAKLDFYKKSMEQDREIINQNSALQNALSQANGEGDGYIIVDENHPDYCLISKDQNGQYYVQLSTANKGIDKESIKVYYNYVSTNASGQKLSEPVEGYYFEEDDYGFIKYIRGISPKVTENNTRNSVYVTYKYKPLLYYSAIELTWTVKEFMDSVRYNEYKDLLGEKDETTGQGLSGLYKTVDDTEQAIIDLTGEKEDEIHKFERLMGPALREGYWQPEDYSDYGEQLEGTKRLPTDWDAANNENFLTDSGTSFFVGWDEELFDEEEKNYYEISASETNVYYPCIDLSDIYDDIKNDIESYSFIFNNNYEGSALNNIRDSRYTQQFVIGSKALLQFVRYYDFENNNDPDNNKIIPVLVLVGAKTMSDEQIEFMKRTTTTVGNVTTYGGNPRLAKIATNSDGTTKLDANGRLILTSIQNLTEEDFLPVDTRFKTVYPRIKFSSLDLKTNSSDMVIRYNNVLLEIAKDYYVNTRNTERPYGEEVIYYPEHYITIKPEVIFKNKTLNGNVKIQYVLSNANTAIYLDAVKISKENAEPKVEYEVTATILNREMISTLYNKLAHIVMINDTELKFENVFGYISGLELDLDNPSNDTVEVKNYKTKFEDLFSTIVAETEEMKRAGSGFLDAAAGKISLQGGALEATLENNNSILAAYLDSHFDTSQFIIDRLQSLFTEAGEILGDSNNTLTSMRSLTLENAAILSGFARNVAQELSTKVHYSDTKPLSYKPGDVWIDGNGDYWVATGYSSDSNGTSGFVRTYDGSLASITGAGMDIDAEKGLIDIYGANEIKLRSGEHIYIGANDTVDIVGNKSVNIGGGTINIAANALGNGGTGGINLVSVGIDFTQSDNTIDSAINTEIQNEKINNIVTSKVLIHPTEILMAAAALTMKGSHIELIASTGATATTSAISIDPNKGIWIGAGQSITLFSGSGVGNQADHASGATVSLTPTKLLFGLSTASNSTAVEMTKDYIIIAAGNGIANLEENDINTNNSLTGIKIKKDYFGLAVGTGEQRSIITMNNNGIIVGTGSNPVGENQTGSYVSISGNGVEIGSLGNLYLNTNNVKLQTNSSGTKFALGQDLQGINTNNIQSSSDNNMGFGSSKVGLVYNANGLYINGNVYATTFQANGADSYFKADSSSFGFYKTSNNSSLLNISASGLVCGGTFTISATNLKLGTVSSSKTIKKYYEDGDSSVGWVSTTGIEIKNNDINISATGALTLASGSSLTMMNDASNSAIILNKNGITATTKATIDFSAAKEIKLKANSISMAAISDYTAPDLSGYYSVISGIDITESGVDIVGRDRIYLGTSTYANKNNGNYIEINQASIDIRADEGAFQINGEPVWARGDIIYSVDFPTDHPTDRAWLWVQPIGVATTVYRLNSNGTLAASSPLNWSQGQITIKASGQFRITKQTSIDYNNIAYTLTIAGYTFSNGVDHQVNFGNGKFVIEKTINAPTQNPFGTTTISYEWSLATNYYLPHYLDSLVVEVSTPSSQASSGSECKVFYYTG